MSQFLVAALYKFVQLNDFALLQAPILEVCKANEVRGTLLLATEGINGTIAGPEQGIRNVLAYLRQDPRFANLEHKESWASEEPFYRMKVKLKKEIVTLGVPGISPTHRVGQYVKPENWNALPHAKVTQDFGRVWLQEKEFPFLKVPSARLNLSFYPLEHNLLINPDFPDFQKHIEVVDEVRFDYLMNSH